MAVENLGKCVTMPASGDHSANQYKFMKIDSNARAALCDDGADATGVLQNDPAAIDRAASVMIGAGRTKVVAGGTVTTGNYVASDSSGRAVNAASGDYILGVAEETASVAGTMISILFQPGHATL